MGTVVLQAALLLGSERAIPTELCGEIDATCLGYAKLILGGQHEVVIGEILKSINLIGDCSIEEPQELYRRLNTQLAERFEKHPNLALLLAVALLQSFIQSNFTGPAPTQSAYQILSCSSLQKEQLHQLSVSLLSVLGQPAYDLCDDAIFLVMSLILLEQTSKQTSLFVDIPEELSTVEISAIETPAIVACAHWWRARALLTQLSLLPEPSGPHPIVASSILSSIDLVYAITKELPPHLKSELENQLGISYYLENVKCSLATNTEHLCLPSLIKVQKLTGFQFVLTGARAKRTKYQQEARSGLIILANSSPITVRDQEKDSSFNPESFALESDYLLERPIFQSIGDEPLDEQIVKRPKIDQGSGIDEEKLLPVALRQEDIPIDLRELDPNNQPALANHDNIQLLLRMQVIRQTTPAQNPMVEQELSAIVGRVLYQSGQKNWTLFSRGLWERSLIETTKAKTVERGLLQMQSLVEELGLKIKTRLLPQESEGTQVTNVERLKFVHQVPFVPRWALDAKLAEKYMSLGILKSAVEIYERLSMTCEAALCHAAAGDERTAEEMLIKRIQENPKDARAYSILGDIRQDPDLWVKSWDIGKYVNSKNALARYFYNPPASSGLKKDHSACLKHLNESLRLYPLSFDTWFFYGCVGLECGRIELAAEAFTRCVSLDATHSLAWSNLSAAFMELGKLKEAHSCLSKATSSDSPNNWRIWDNYMLVSIKLNLWPDVLLACRKLVEIRKGKVGEFSIDLPVVEKLVELLVTSEFPSEASARLTHFQSSCMEFICEILPGVVTTNSRCWKQVAKVELWRKRPWASLDCYEKEYRAMSHNPDLEFDEKVWNDSVDTCDDLVSAYESLGEMEGKHGLGSLVCKDWKYKARSTIKSLMSRGKNNWEDSDGWERLVELRNNL
ncbi:LANO_0E04896g1_1 [Lachancea nothofagi CBS 11611]|uniref:LANO_0E04896g1_1 n=1 Tax=Lachancea nothofagi CBS 11611 TaxID=1266666 RepID=A0A1G4JSW4_9SACH|nr:LANO_0E04896g1_1 [Lachancea nothofagi CBS 11611]